MNILYIAGDDPKEMGCGTQVRTHYLWKALERVGEVSVYVIPKRQRIGFIPWLFRGFTKVGIWPFRPALDVARLFPGVKFDCVVTRYLRNAAETAAWKIAPLYVDVDDVPLQAFELEKDRLPAGVRWLAALVVRWWQRFILKKCRGAWIVKEDDRRYLPRSLPCSVLRNLAKEPEVWPRPEIARENLLMTVGLMGYGPNIDGVLWFLRTVWEPFHAQHPDWRYAIAGKGAPEALQQECARIGGVELLGFVDDLDALYAKSAAVVAPIMTGAGSCVKVVESALHGRTTFVTPFAARGIPEEDAAKLGFRLFDDLQSFERSFAAWIDLSDDVQQVRELTILETAKGYNSFEQFAAVVHERMICFLTR